MTSSQKSKKFSTKKKLLFTLISVFLMLFIVWMVGEVVCRVIAEKSDGPYKEKSIISDRYGWFPKENYTATYEMKEKKGRSYDVTYSTTKNGFREWGDVNANRPKILFVGDSYIQSVEVSNEKLFYNILGDSLNAEIFACGQAGFGTLQQKFIIEDYFDEIKPDLIVIQTCDNDFIDNYPPLEYHSYYRVGIRRPYYDNKGNLYYQEAKPLSHRIIGYSKFLDLIRRKLENAFPSEKVKSSQERIAKEGKDFNLYAESIEITDVIMKDIKSDIGSTPLIGFSASAYEPQLSDMESIFKQNNIPFLKSIGLKALKAKRVGISMHSADGYHWNENGHRKIAEFLLDDLQAVLEKNQES